VRDEAQLFLPLVANETVFQDVIDYYWGSYPPASRAIHQKFPLAKYNGSQTARLKAFYQFATFTCNTRFIANGFKTYNLQYSHGTGLHGSDVPADFYNNETNSDDPTFGTFARSFQSYLVSHARTGNPNKLRDAGAINWPLVEKGRVFGDVLEAGNAGFRLIDDQLNKAEDCDFWLHLARNMTDELDE
jgi:carboxylesterase type B